jgi:dipeptidyl aminopeptidase/acylaminoacyl peptidase
MKMFRSTALAIILTLVVLIVYKTTRNDNLIPRELLFGNPDKASVSISPDGKRIGYLSSKDKVLNIYVADRTKPNKGIPVTKDKKRGIRNYWWAYDNKHILYSQDQNGDENWHIYKVDIDTLKVTDLTPFPNTKAYLWKASEHIPNKLVLGINNRDPKYFDLYEVDINSGKLELMHENKEEFTEEVISDDDGKYELKFATKIHKDGSKTIYKVDKGLQPFLKVPAEDAEATDILGFGETSNIVYVLSSIGRNTTALIKYNQADGTSEVIHHDLKTDIGGIVFKPRKKTPQVVYNTFLRRSAHILDDSIKPDLQYLEDFNKDGEPSIVDRDLNDHYWIVGYLSDKKPYEYYLYDVKNKKAEFLFSTRKKLAKYALAPMWPMIIKSRDGLDLISYLTVPNKALNKANTSFIPTKPVPLVLYVHGGPKGIRDDWGFNPIHQLLANRGYAVLSVNYRASGGFGKNFMNAGDGEWGRKMHYDLLDAVNWAINKITTKDKVAIFGGSYGGYAALVGATFTPDVFACAISEVGPSNLITLAESIPEEWKPYRKGFISTIGGDPDTEEGRRFLKSRSPLTYVKHIKKPLLIAQGANDPRVHRIESDQIVRAMRKNKIPVTYLVYPDEGHGFARPENNLSFYAVVEQFLAKNLGGRSEPIGRAFKGSSIQLEEGGEAYLKYK